MLIARVFSDEIFLGFSRYQFTTVPCQ